MLCRTYEHNSSTIPKIISIANSLCAGSSGVRAEAEPRPPAGFLRLRFREEEVWSSLNVFCVSAAAEVAAASGLSCSQNAFKKADIATADRITAAGASTEIIRTLTPAKYTADTA